MTRWEIIDQITALAEELKPKTKKQGYAPPQEPDPREAEIKKEIKRLTAELNKIYGGLDVTNRSKIV